MDEIGVPLSIIVTGANRHDVTQVANVLDGRVVFPPKGTTQNLCADKGYVGENARKIMVSRGYVPHVRQRKEEIDAKKNIPGYKNRRWVVEVTHSWFNRFRKILVRYEKHDYTYEALLQLAAAIITFRKTGVIYG